MKTQRVVCFVVVAYLLLLPVGMRAQTMASGTIAGVVKDPSGAVIPGVTVEASSPELIEKVRDVTTDSGGQYKIVNLRPGTYTVTFTLAGFGTVKQEGILLTAAFTATVDAEMAVGSVQQTVNVAAEVPLVDTQNVMQNETLEERTVEQLPIGKGYGLYASIVPGAILGAGVQDVGGFVSDQQGNFSIHGDHANDMNLHQDGMEVNSLSGAGANTSGFNRAGLVETTIETGGITAEDAYGGVQVNAVPKEGGNTWHWSLMGSGTGSPLETSGDTPFLLSRHITTTALAKNQFDLGGALGGKLIKDKLWFLVAQEDWHEEQYSQGNYYNADENAYTLPSGALTTIAYAPNHNEPAYVKQAFRDTLVRLAWQATKRNRFTGSIDFFHNCVCYNFLAGAGTSAPEAAANVQFEDNRRGIFNWIFPATSKLLIEAGGGLIYVNVDDSPEPGTTPNDIAITESTTGYVYGALAKALGPTGSYGAHFFNSINEHASVSYVTGSHNFKFGATAQESWKNFNDIINGGLSYTFKSGVPQSLEEWAQPQGEKEDMDLYGYYAQDQWTLFHRLTLNYGLRLDYLDGTVPAQSQPAGTFTPARSFGEVGNVPQWVDLDPRIGAAYDLFGNGKTVVKGFIGRYVSFESLNGMVSVNNPMNTIVNTATRSWTDSNKNFVPDCNLALTTANGECGALSNSAFGTSVVNTSIASDALNGLNHRGYNWQMSASVQRELRPGVAMTFAYFRTWYGNFLTENNTDVTNSDFTPYCVTAPVDSRLPSSVSGQQLCGFYDINPAQYGQVKNVISQASDFGKQTDIYNGFDVTTNIHFGEGGLISGGVSIGQEVTDDCYLNNQPRLTQVAYPPSSTSLTVATGIPLLPAYCHVAPPWIDGTQLKLQTIYPLPWALQVSATYQNLAGIPVQAINAFTSAQIAPSLGRPLSEGAGTSMRLDLMVPDSVFESRLNQFDLRFTRNFKIKERSTIQANFDIYNMFNASTILAESTGYTAPGATVIGAAWLQPTTILGPRIFKFGAEYNF